MHPKAIERAKTELAEARDACAQLRLANSLADFERAWRRFLWTSNRIYGRLRDGAKGVSASEAWLGRKKHQRKNDPLLSYVHHARNSDEHLGLADIAEKEAGRMSLTAEDGPVLVKSFVVTPNRIGGDIRSLGGRGKLRVDFTPDRIRLIPVVDRGVTYAPALAHLGRKVDGRDPLVVAEASIDFFESLIAEAEAIS